MVATANSTKNFDKNSNKNVDKKADVARFDKKVYGLGIRSRMEGIDPILFDTAIEPIVKVNGEFSRIKTILSKSQKYTVTLSLEQRSVQGKHTLVVKSGKEVVIEILEEVNGKGLAFDWEVMIEKGAKATIGRTIYAHSASVFTTLQMQIQSNSTVILKEIIQEGNFVRNQTMSFLDENVTLTHTTLFHTTHEHEIAASAHVAGRESTVSLIARGVVEENAKGLFLGELKIMKNAVHCQAHQKSEILLLSQQSIGEAVPILEVENNDVICSHSATVSQIDEEMLFYLQSRGIELETAKKMITKGFLRP